MRVGGCVNGLRKEPAVREDCTLDVTYLRILGMRKGWGKMGKKKKKKNLEST